MLYVEQLDAVRHAHNNGPPDKTLSVMLALFVLAAANEWN